MEPEGHRPKTVSEGLKAVSEISQQLVGLIESGDIDELATLAERRDSLIRQIAASIKGSDKEEAILTELAQHNDALMGMAQHRRDEILDSSKSNQTSRKAVAAYNSTAARRP